LPNSAVTLSEGSIFVIRTINSFSGLQWSMMMLVGSRDPDGHRKWWYPNTSEKVMPKE
jgi:hypothetical protein